MIDELFSAMGEELIKVWDRGKVRFLARMGIKTKEDSKNKQEWKRQVDSTQSPSGLNDLKPMKPIPPCSWAPMDDALYRSYHDEEWGVPEYDDRQLFEKLVLDGFQAGLSWRTILYKRDSFRTAFDQFSPEKIAKYGEPKVRRLLQDQSIIRSELKIRATIGNARCYLKIMEAGTGAFSSYLWNFVEGSPIVESIKSYKDHPVQSPESESLAKDLKSKGFKFCGPVITYAFMQAVGMVNGHEIKCPRWREVNALAR